MLAGGGDPICVQKRGGAHVRIHHYEQVWQPYFPQRIDLKQWNAHLYIP
jgi:hypothetical protein